MKPLSPALPSIRECLDDIKLVISNKIMLLYCRHQVGDVKKTDLPGPDALYRPGSSLCCCDRWFSTAHMCPLIPGNKEGQVIMVKQPDGSVEAHQVRLSCFIGRPIAMFDISPCQVVDEHPILVQNWYCCRCCRSEPQTAFRRPGIRFCFRCRRRGRQATSQTSIQRYASVFWTFASATPLTLPAENPYDAAQKFLARNNLPLTYLDEVVKFIEKNTGGIELGTGASQGDPYTGGQAYRTGSGGAAPASATAASAQPPSSSGTFPFVRLASLKVAHELADAECVTCRPSL